MRGMSNGGAPKGATRRIAYLDGLRGLAILLTVVWHYLGPIYAVHLPYRTAYAHLPLARHGWAGVNLFFLISGYVIFLTLERAHGLADFLARRWLRLFPGMLLASLIVYAAAAAMSGAMPGGAPHPADLLPGLAFTNPFYLHHWLGLDARSLDGAFWSLYVEVAFYVAIGLMYFRLGWARSTAGLLLLYALAVALPLVQARWQVGWLHEPMLLVDNSGLVNFAWFASGALFLKAREEGDRGLYWLAIAVGFAACTTSLLPGGLEPSARYALFAALALFALLEVSPRARAPLESAPMQALGRLSYPFYLLHSGIGVGLIATLGPWAARAGLPGLATPAIVLAAMLLLAHAVARWFEPWATRALRPLAVAARRARRAPRPEPAPPAPPAAAATAVPAA